MGAGLMTIHLTPEAEALIQQLLAQGDYDNPEAVVEEALQTLVERDKLARLQAAIAVGDEQASQGRVIPWTPDFLDRLKRQSTEHVRLGKPFKDEAIP
jgi:putative addiction module CopG family antidote